MVEDFGIEVPSPLLKGWGELYDLDFFLAPFWLGWPFFLPHWALDMWFDGWMRGVALNHSISLLATTEASSRGCMGLGHPGGNEVSPVTPFWVLLLSQVG